MTKKRKKITEFSKRMRTPKAKKGGKIEIEYRNVKRPVNVVGNGLRFVHYMIDAFLIAVLNNVISMLGIYSLILPEQDPSFGPYSLFFIGPGAGAIFGVMMFLGTAYYTVFEAFTQRTPGKMVTGCFVIDEYGKAPDFRKSLVRSLLRLIPFEAFSCLSERGWHDTMSETWVVQKEELDTINRLYSQDEDSEELL